MIHRGRYLAIKARQKSAKAIQPTNSSHLTVPMDNAGMGIDTIIR